MASSLPVVLVPGLLCSARLWAEQIPALWRHGPVTVADHRQDDSMEAIAERILASAPPRFALAGLSMGGYIAFVIARQAIKGVPTVTATFNAELVGTARAGDLVECTGDVVKAGRSMVFVRGIISNASAGGEPMMSFSSVLKKTAPRP